MGQQLAIDVGPVYVRLVVLLPGLPDPSLPDVLSIYSTAVQGTFYCLKYLPEQLDHFQAHPIYSRLTLTPAAVKVTGLCAKLVGEKIGQCFGANVTYAANTQSLIKAIDYMRVNHPDSYFHFPGESFPQVSSIGRFSDTGAKKIRGLPTGSFYPLILVNLRSGLSIYRLNSATDFKRIQGSCLGGTTIWSLMKLMTSFKTPEEALIASMQGDNSLIDMSVGDIYGSDYGGVGLRKDMVASSCAKLRFADEVDEHGLAKSLFGMFILNITQIACFISMAEEVDKVLVTGNMITVPVLMESAQACMNFWSRGTRQMLFNEYSFFMGALGELI